MLAVLALTSFSSRPPISSPGTPIEDRVEFTNEWKVGSEHGMVHDGLQADGYLELRLDWKAPGKRAGDDWVSKVAIIRVNPWLAYGTGEGARLAIRKPDALESTASTLQRTLRDDYVVVRRDGSDSELTVDPTPFTVVPASNPRHKPGIRLLILYEGACVDACVEPWPEAEIDIKDGSRHLLRVEGKLLSGWVTMINAAGVTIIKRSEELDVDGDGIPDTEQLAHNTKHAAAQPAAGVSATEGDAGGVEEGAPAPEAAVEEDLSGVWVSTRKKGVAIYSGSDPNNSEKLGMLTNKMPVRVLEKRAMEDGAVRAYISTIPAQANILYTTALNEFNHSVQRFATAADYETARGSYCDDMVAREEYVEDAITGNQLRIKDQTLKVSTTADAADNRDIPAEWKVDNVLDLVVLLLRPSPLRWASGRTHSTGRPKRARSATRRLRAGFVPQTWAA